MSIPLPSLALVQEASALTFGEEVPASRKRNSSHLAASAAEAVLPDAESGAPAPKRPHLSERSVHVYPSTSRGRGASAEADAVAAEALSDDDDPDEEVKWVHREKFEEATQVIARLPTFPERIRAFRDYLTPVRGGLSELWLTLNSGKEVHLNITLCQGKYEKSPVGERIFCEALRSSQRKHLIYIKVFEYKNYDSPVLQMRISPTGHLGELLWLQRGKDITGSQILDLYLYLESVLQIQTTYLYDVAKMTAPPYRPGKKRPFRFKRKIPLRSLAPVAREDGHNWYRAKAGFLPSDIDQTPDAYYTAILTLRDTQLSDLAYFMQRYEKKGKTLAERSPIHMLYSNYLAMARRSPSLEESDKTLHDLACSIYARSKNPLAPDEERALAMQDLALLTHHCLVYYKPYGKVSAAEKTHTAALWVLENTRIFERRRPPSGEIDLLCHEILPDGF